MYPKVALGIALLAACGMSLAQRLDGSWSARIHRDGEDFLYEVHLAYDHERLVGIWSVDATRPSGGCLVGTAGARTTRFRICTTDGSAGSRDMKAVCPAYHPDQNRFVSQGSKLGWEVWDEQRRSWRRFVQFERAGTAQPVQWDQHECGKP